MRTNQIQDALQSADTILKAANVPSATDLLGVICLLYIDIKRAYPEFETPSVNDAGNLIKQFA